MKVTRKSKRLLSILFVFLLPSHLFSQAASMPMEASTEGEPVTEVQEDETDEGGNRTIKGIIYDEQGETIIGASVLIKGEETTGTTSDMDGKFTLNVPSSKSVLVISYIGYTTQEIPVNNQKILNINLKEDTKVLDEVVVVGYGVQKKSHLTGSVSKMDVNNLTDIPVTQVDQLLQGKIAGVNIRTPLPRPELLRKSVYVVWVLSVPTVLR